MNLFEAIAKRYSHKEAFLPDPIPAADLAKIAKAGIDAPSGMNSQTVQVVILPTRQDVEPLCEIGPTWGMQTCPAALMVFTDNALSPTFQQSLEKEDYSTAMGNMLLAATALGYSTLWLDSPYWDEDRQKAARELVGAPDSYHLWAVIPVGKPDGEGSRRPKQPAEQRISYLKVGRATL